MIDGVRDDETTGVDVDAQRPSRALTEFRFLDRVIRMVLRDGNPWFVAADVCQALDIGNVSQAVSRLEANETTLITNEDGQGGRGFNIISEGGLYVLVLTSRKPQAIPFQRWVTNEVLPSIRRTGAYQVPSVRPERPVRDWAQPFHHPFYDTMVVSTSPGPFLGSMPGGDVTVSVADFCAFSSFCSLNGAFDARDFDHPNESKVLHYLDRHGRGNDCARNPLTGRWVFKIAALQDWHHAQGSIQIKPPV